LKRKGEDRGAGEWLRRYRGRDVVVEAPKSNDLESHQEKRSGKVVSQGESEVGVEGFAGKMTLNRDMGINGKEGGKKGGEVKKRRRMDRRVTMCLELDGCEEISSVGKRRM